MTRADAIASILKKLGDAHYQAADELLALASNESGTSVSVSGAEAASSPGAAPPSLPPSIDELPFDDALIPDEFREPQPSMPRNSEEDRVLSECPVHFRPWTVKEGGISKNGKPYKAFWKCNGKNADGSFCDKKPTAGWIKTHDPEKALAAA